MAPRLQKKQLLDLPVYTKSGQHLGRVIDFTFDAASQTIIQYTVGSSDILKKILNQQELIVGAHQVLNITTKKMTVDDTTTGIPVTSPKPVPAG
ncbi:MAG: PRC-barrel domain-containing protein [Patescibacteria group bacterium]